MVSQSLSSLISPSLCISVNDVLFTEEGCYQNLGSELNYEDAEYACSTELEGRLVLKESVGNISSFLASQISVNQPGMSPTWWLAGGSGDTCPLLTGGGGGNVSEEDCTGVSRALCYLGLHCDSSSQELVGEERCQCGCQASVLHSHWSS